MIKSKLSLNVRANKPGCRFFLALDGKTQWEDSVDQNPKKIQIEFDDSDDVEHTLTLGMTGKTRYHTKIGPDGEIIDDLLISVSDISLDDIDIEHLFYEVSKYDHDFNGTGKMSEHRFFGTMGCNGQVTMKFRTPVYLWLLENL